MLTPNESNLNKCLVAFLSGDRRAGGALYSQVRATVLSIARRRAPDLHADREDVLNEVFVIMMESPKRFDPTRGSARAFIVSVLIPDAIQRIRARSARPGTTTRRRNVITSGIMPTFPMLDPIADPETLPSAGHGSPVAIEAACDAHMIESRATPMMRLIIGGLMDNKTEVEIAAEMSLGRHRIRRIIVGLRRQFANAA